ncbi:hypothetical protein J6590_023926 [Homalodisca vitripennis]|nr:hypothetical protein J6590_023926 [Homalodisca vitripennis]
MCTKLQAVQQGTKSSHKSMYKHHTPLYGPVCRTELYDRTLPRCLTLAVVTIGVNVKIRLIDIGNNDQSTEVARTVAFQRDCVFSFVSTRQLKYVSAFQAMPKSLDFKEVVVGKPM